MKKRNNNIVLAEITDQLNKDVQGTRTTKLIDDKNFDTYVEKGEEKDRLETKKIVYRIAEQTALPFHKLIDKETKTKLLKDESIATNEIYHEQLTECIAGYIVNTDPIITNRDEMQKQIVETLQAALAKDKDFGMTHGSEPIDDDEKENIPTFRLTDGTVRVPTNPKEGIFTAIKLVKVRCPKTMMDRTQDLLIALNESDALGNRGRFVRSNHPSLEELVNVLQAHKEYCGMRRQV